MLQNPFGLMFKVLGIVSHHIWLWGWVFLPILLAPFLWDAWLYYIRIRTLKSLSGRCWNFVYRQMWKKSVSHGTSFGFLQSTLFKGGWWKRYVEGRVQEWFSLEITSFDGELHFYIRTLAQFRNLVEAAIYAQYPQAEILMPKIILPMCLQLFPTKPTIFWL